LREIEPYVHCQTTYAKFNANHGKSRVPWLSGTASWAYYTATHWILGIRPEFDGLRIAPCIPKDWPGFTMTRNFRGMNLHIEVRNPRRKCRGLKSLTVDGRPVAGDIISVADLRDGSRIVATLG